MKVVISVLLVLFVIGLLAPAPPTCELTPRQKALIQQRLGPIDERNHP